MNVCMYECMSVWDYIDPDFIINKYNVHIHPIKMYYNYFLNYLDKDNPSLK